MINFRNIDCMVGMKEYPDKYFDLAIVDPPYGGGCNEYDATKQRYGGRFSKYFQPKVKAERRGCGHNKYNDNICEWDIAPTPEYFEELFRISKNQIIWGGNYFELPPTRCFVVWRKLHIPLKGFEMAPVEYAWTSFNRNAVMFEVFGAGTANNVRFHPTQKPVALYEELLDRFANDGDKILDTHVGSGSSLIACYNMRFDVVGFEINETYYKKAQERIAEHTAQIRMDL